MSAMVPSNDSYLNMSVLKQVRNRLPWLLILMFSSIFTGIIINHYEAAFETLPVLVALMPMLSDTGGNCGSQTSTLIIRGMALNEINIQDFLKVFWKEFRIGFLVGVVLAITNGVRVMIQYRNLKIAIIIANGGNSSNTCKNGKSRPSSYCITDFDNYCGYLCSLDLF